MKLRPKTLKTLTVAVTCAMLAVWSTGTANATAYTWQGFSRDSSWNCGPSGSTINVNGLYLLPCTKTSGRLWQVILIATAGGGTTYLADTQTEEWGNGNSGSGSCNYDTIWGEQFVPGMSSLACFSPTLNNANTWVWGQFDVTVLNSSGYAVSKTIVSPLVLTGS